MDTIPPQEAERRLGGLPGWAVVATRAHPGQDAIEKEFTFADFSQALAFANRVGALAEEADHHPDILLHGYKRVTITLTTHSAGGITERDLALAARIESAAGGESG